MKTTRFPKPPAHLSQASKIWWTETVKEYDLEKHHLMLLQAACEVWDQLQQARELIARDGLMIKGPRGALRIHPAAGVERDSGIGFARLLRELDLDVEPPSSSRLPQPPALRSNRRG